MSDSANLVDCSSSASVWSMPEAIRNFTCMFSNIQIANGLLDVDGPFRVQPTECFYEASGSFAPTRRIIFYVLLLLSTCFRRKYFISGVCMGIIMSYSTVASIQAIILVSTRYTQISALIERITIAPNIQIPIWPMIWAGDTDCVLAICGTAMLFLAPMGVWSHTIREILQSDCPEALKKRRVLIGWFFLLLAGLICAWVNEIWVDLFSVGQFTICSQGGNVSDIVSGNTMNLAGGRLPGKSLNETIWQLLSTSSAMQEQIPTCIHTCIGAPGFSDNVKVIPANGGWPNVSNYSNMVVPWVLMTVSMLFMMISFATIVAIYVLQPMGRRRGSNRTAAVLVRDDGEGDEPLENGHERWSIRWWFDTGARALALASFIFVGWIESVIWPFPTAGKIWEVDHWGDVLTILLVVIFATYYSWDDSWDYFKKCLRMKRKGNGEEV
jgi:hypothetical protein